MNNLEVISKALVYIENHLREPLPAKDAAAAVAYSYYHFHRFFQAVVGETPGSYIRTRRLTLAAWDLVHSDKRVLDIGMELYFETAESFTRAFKKRYGMTPTEYRKNGVDILLYNRGAAYSADNGIPATCAGMPEIVTAAPVSVFGLRSGGNLNDNRFRELFEYLNERIGQEYPELAARPRYGVYETDEPCAAETFSADSGCNIFVGVAVAEGEADKETMSLKHLPGGTYARFIHTGPVRTLLDTYRYIWGVWFPKSGYELSDRDDFECYTERFLGAEHPDSQIDIYFPVREV